MRIAVDIRVLGTGRTSGVEEYTERLLEHMLPLDSGIDFKLFYAGRRRLVRRPWMEAPNIQLYQSGWSNRLLTLSSAIARRPYLDRLVDGADVFFFPHFLAGATGPNCRRVLTMHDLSFERFPEFFSFNRRLWHALQARPRAHVRAADRIIAVSESTRRDVIDIYGTTPEKVLAIPSGVDAKLARADDEDIERFRAKHGLPDKFILTLGTLEPRKNIAGLIEAFDALPIELHDVELVIAGQKGWLCDDLRSMAGQSRRIRFVDYINNEERSLWLSAAEILAYPSFFEGFGFPPLEAMACGTPVIVGANSSMIEVCGSAALAVNPYSLDEITTALTLLLSDERLRRDLVDKGLERAESYSWQKSAEMTLTALSTW